MPKKRKNEKTIITVVVDGKPIKVTLYPPTGRKKTWYAYWAGLTYSLSTGQRNLDDAVAAAEDMVRNGGSRSTLPDSLLSDDDFDRIQQRHYGKKKDEAAKKRAEKSLKSCMEAISAFREITGLKPIAKATPDDCEIFQHTASELPKNWRSKYPNSQEDVERISPNTIIKWSVALQAAFERANRNAGRKCVRGVVSEEKLLTENPWKKFTWIEGRDTEIRQFDPSELLSFLDHLDSKWPGVTVAPLVAKTCLWSWGRKTEVMGLRWDSERAVGDEHHFHIVGKWGVEKWFRVPRLLYQELQAVKTDSPYVFSAYNDQLRSYHENGKMPWLASRVSDDFNPNNLGDWFYERVKKWSESLPKGAACIHIFRKTTLQYARAGEDLNRQVAADGKLGEGVMMTNYVKETDEEMRHKSNRTFRRILASLPPEVAERYGCRESKADVIKRRLRNAVDSENWGLVARLAGMLAERDRRAG